MKFPPKNTRFTGSYLISLQVQVNHSVIFSCLQLNRILFFCFAVKCGPYTHINDLYHGAPLGYYVEIQNVPSEETVVQSQISNKMVKISAYNMNIAHELSNSIFTQMLHESGFIGEIFAARFFLKGKTLSFESELLNSLILCKNSLQSILKTLYLMKWSGADFKFVDSDAADTRGFQERIRKKCPFDFVNMLSDVHLINSLYIRIIKYYDKQRFVSFAMTTFLSNLYEKYTFYINIHTCRITLPSLENIILLDFYEVVHFLFDENSYAVCLPFLFSLILTKVFGKLIVKRMGKIVKTKEEIIAVHNLDSYRTFLQPIEYFIEVVDVKEIIMSYLFDIFSGFTISSNRLLCIGEIDKILLKHVVLSI